MQVIEAQCGVDLLIGKELLAQELGGGDVELFAVVEGGELGVQGVLDDVQEGGGLVVDDDHLVVVVGVVVVVGLVDYDDFLLLAGEWLIDYDDFL